MQRGEAFDLCGVLACRIVLRAGANFGVDATLTISSVQETITVTAETPILMLTARDDDIDKIVGLEMGADDYLTKPFHPEELMARVRALLRRTGRWTQSRLQCGPVEIDSAAQRVYLHGDEVALTAYEYRVLEYLVLHAGEVIPKSRLSDHI